jgi:hypothetical protein
MSEPRGAKLSQSSRVRVQSRIVRVKMRSGEIVFYVVAGMVALTIALQPRSLVAAVLFVAATAIALAVALES